MIWRKCVVALLAAASSAWLAAVAGAPLLLLRDQEAASTWRAAAGIYAIGALVCHQRPERSFHTAGVQWPVCARCTGVYAGAAAGLLLWSVVIRRAARVREAMAAAAYRTVRLRRFTMAIAAPTLFTVATGALHLFDPSNGWRAALALPLGAWAGVLLAAVVLHDLTPQLTPVKLTPVKQ